MLSSLHQAPVRLLHRYVPHVSSPHLPCPVVPTPRLQVLFSTRFAGYTAETFGPEQRERFIADFLAAAVRTTGLPPGERGRPPLPCRE